METNKLVDQTRLQSRLEAPKHVSRADAQKGANFLVLYPDSIPNDIILVSETFRPELPPGRPPNIDLDFVKASPWTDANTCTLRSEYAGPARRLRIKQFFYDWAPPAGTIAAIWDSSSFSPVFCEQTVGWLGTDYKGGFGGSIERYGTQVELSVLDGEFSKYEICEIFGSLQPACPDAFKGTSRSHRQNYWIRHHVPPLKTPYGLWAYPHRRAYDGKCTIGSPDQRIADWTCVSAVAMAKEIDGQTHQDYERVFLHQTDPDAWVIVSSIPCQSPASFAFPPDQEKQQIAYRNTWVIKDRLIFAAAVDPAYGGWDLRWETQGFGHGLWTSASRLWSRSSVQEFVRCLL